VEPVGSVHEPVRFPVPNCVYNFLSPPNRPVSPVYRPVFFVGTGVGRFGNPSRLLLSLPSGCHLRARPRRRSHASAGGKRSQEWPKATRALGFGHEKDPGNGLFFSLTLASSL
jgi:hypothetical protein